MNRPRVIVFDVNGTLSDMSPLSVRFGEVGAPEWAASLWFSSLLRDGFALAAAGASASFSVIGHEVLQGVLARFPLSCAPEAAVAHIEAALTELRPHVDVAEGIVGLATMGLRLVTLSNGATGVAERLLSTAGLRDAFERVLSVDDAGVWKPAAGAYAYAASACGVDFRDMLMVAAHAWDVDGAGRVGMRTAWINREGIGYPGHLRPPDINVKTLGQLAAELTEQGDAPL